MRVATRGVDLLDAPAAVAPFATPGQVFLTRRPGRCVGIAPASACLTAVATMTATGSDDARPRINGRQGTASSHWRTRPGLARGALAMRRVVRPLLLALVVLALAAPAALGARPIHEKFTVDETFTEELCGITVTTRVQLKGNVLIFEDRVIDASQVTVTWTNTEDNWLELFVAGPAFVEEQLEGDILIIDVRIAGIPERIRSSEGLTPAFDRGLVIFRDTIDLNDLEDPEDDVFLGREVFFQAGPHPDLDSDFALFCEVVHDVLG
jgi:hypothetical protein